MNADAASDKAELPVAARVWRDDDPDPRTRAQLDDLITRAKADDALARAELADCFAGALGFGTAGLRAALGPGPNRMNSAVVMRAAAALAGFLHEVAEGDEPGLVVVGYDARHNSAQFAHDTCAVLTGFGLPVAVMPHHCPTPVLAFAVQHLEAAAGVMVTASHNPAKDNGYKVYLGAGSGLDYRGSQIVPPVDARIAALMTEAGPVREIPLGEEWLTLDDSVMQAYVERAVEVVSPDGPRTLRVVHTAMHGVGGEAFRVIAMRTGFTDIHEVAEQALPDPDFPTVAFPNPEEPGALDLAFATARATDADVVIAHDPDADRCAVALPIMPTQNSDAAGTSPVERANDDAAGPSGTQSPTSDAAPASRTQQWQRLSGDDVGLLLGWWRLEQSRTGARPLPAHAVFASSIVSGSLLQRLCEREGIAHQRTLTGFKWLARIPDFAYGYEEALGYCVDPEAVRDKDGITASLAVMECLAQLKTQGTSATAVIEQLRAELGGGVTHNESVTIPDAAAASAILRRLLHEPPQSLAGTAVIGVDDLAIGVDGLPPTTGVRWRLTASGQTPARVIIRPSGTEPKVKCYVEAETADQAVAIASGCANLITAAGA
ncbi:MAG: phospho-sugar mutase [Actinomycetales bacterium]|nr:phospho-sugar mutase [Actinomycetales bacterium]